MTEEFDLIAIGGGTAGLVSAAGAAYLGARVALVERDRLGGDCLWTGCVPSKALIASARAAQIRRDSGLLGIPGKARPVDFALVMESMRKARELVSHHDDPERFRAMGVEVVTGSAEFAASHTVRVGDRMLRAKRIVIATGSRPVLPPISGLAEAGPLTHQTVFDLNSPPAAVAIIGGGPIGAEFAQLFQRLGVPVVLFEVATQLLPREDPQASAVMRGALEREGVTIHTGVQVLRVESEAGDRIVVWRGADGAEMRVVVEEILVAAGRAPNIDGLALERAGVAVSALGILVDARLRSTVPGIWAAGDVSGGPQFTHVADYQARLVVRNALTPFRARADYRAVPAVTYTDPEIARVGRTEEEAAADGITTRAWRYDFADLDRAITDRHREGFVKLVATPRGRLLGATIVGAGAGELIAPVTLAMQQRLPLSALGSFIYPYPTMSEAVLRAANLSRREQLDSFSGRLLKRIVRWGL
jgi:pyruvate/2-oxoglutarate dehydrogenase complex dihydrolipoamide dehydrogenase (E3) component